jgi:hypothetical protein
MAIRMDDALSWGPVSREEKCTARPFKGTRGVETLPQPAFAKFVVTARCPCGTAYPAIVQSVKELMERPELGPLPQLAIDATGVGRAIVDMVIDADIAADISPVTITGGNADFRRECWHGHYGLPAYSVAKLHLIGTVQAALSSGRLKIAPKLAFAEILRKELLQYRVKLTAAANETFEAREGANDDLLLATAIAVWLGTEGYTPSYGLGEIVTIPRDPPRNFYARRPTNPDDAWSQRDGSGWPSQRFYGR